MNAFDIEAYDETYIAELKREIASSERRLTCLILSQPDRQREEEHLRDLRRYKAHEEAKKPSRTLEAA